MKLVDEAVVIEYVEVEDVTSKLLVPDSVKKAATFKPGLKMGIIRDVQTSTVNDWVTSKLLSVNDIVLFNTALPTNPKILDTKKDADGKLRQIEVIYTQEIVGILEETDIKKYNLDMEREYAEAKRRVEEYKKSYTFAPGMRKSE